MDSNQVNFWLSINAENFNPGALPTVKAKLEQLDSNQLMMLQNASFKKPSTILLIALFLGWERFFLGDIALGIVKVITGYGCGIWWLIDIFSAKKRAQKYNLQQFQKMTSFLGAGNANNVVSPSVTPSAPVDTDNSQSVNYQSENHNSGQVISDTQNFYAPPVNQSHSEGLMQKPFARLKGLLVTPHTEYQTIAKENLPHATVLTNYVLLLAIIPFVFSFIGGLITFGNLFDYSFGKAIGGVFQIAFYQLLVLFGGVYITSLIINSMAGKFGGRSDFNRAFALVAYAYTPMFIAGIFNAPGGMSWLVYAVGVYGLYLLLSGLCPMMKPADEKANAYSTVSFIVAVVVYAVLWKVLYLMMMPSINIITNFPYGFPY